ncbi:conserved hypothetical protein [Talaromyces stipitatus ATCC 10500]|uniref:Uncharacterized protein n=1 Tax=Talaromyces stipitatus (strain ATCC 10500 / CBS 375.48 / QM 6759 / NRRL 1006) TaxID=441959 RepID=B8LZZ6_TALSN|nr:uncharacterized protein TSTA_081610 [Talaromyces stipitatus ATCC 10500]EED20928.1 conserved hypothetical protein [Talaromyces stipitatus ATCC 10500]
MSSFCCSFITPYREARLMHETKFQRFMAWAGNSQSSPVSNSDSYFRNPNNVPEFAVQFVQQVNYGPVEAKRYFIPDPDSFAESQGGFLEVTEQDLIIGNFQKLNAYKNYKCGAHNKFFELNLYQKDPVNQHHWRFNISRPASDIDI